ncbi:MAG TPA: UxaA family hydrolase [Vicinamibacterales bacterium]|nr:UxaA family hydrolase [Vicinamibacterales bacterium]
MNPVIVISDADNVATALEALSPGTVLDGIGSVTVRDPIPRGHKIALRAIAAGSSVMKYGSPIGVAIADIPPGAHVHTHNVSSARGRGDLTRHDASAADGRIAEPPDDKGNP